ncbi:MAG TPA: phosphotransferase [Bryobacteraceae bacterium]|nr:phosphotransferase [Bryobacteraceae bacterium]
MIPQEKSEAVTRGLREAFGVTEFADISRITKGHTTSLVFRIIVGGSPYLLKIIMRSEDPTRHYTSMKAAAEAGIAPRVWHTNIDDKISITDFVEAAPLSVSEALHQLPATLRVLHALPPFARAPFNTTCTFLLNKGPAADAFLQRFQAVIPKAVNEEFFARCAELAAVYPHDDAEMVASHNDLFKPDNILFDGQRIWLVDWEAAFLNDRYADLAVVANQVVTNDEEEILYLEKYFGAAPDPYQLARFHLMQQLTHLFYAMGFLTLGSSGKPIDWSGTVPKFSDYHRRMWAGEIDLADNDVKIEYGRVHWERLLQNVRQARYNQALRIVSDRHATV